MEFHDLAVVEVDGGEHGLAVVGVDDRSLGELRDPLEIGAGGIQPTIELLDREGGPHEGRGQDDGHQPGGPHDDGHHQQQGEQPVGEARPGRTEEVFEALHGVSAARIRLRARGYDGSPMRRLALFPLVLTLVFAVPALAQDEQAPTKVEVIQVEGAIDRPLLAYVNERLSIAEREDAVVVLQLDTAGTLDQDAVALADRIANLSVPVVTWVGPAPAKAAGAGLLLMYAASLAAVSPGSQTGPLYPVGSAPRPGRRPDLKATISGWIEARGKDTRLERPRPTSVRCRGDRRGHRVPAGSPVGPRSAEPDRRGDGADAGGPGRAPDGDRDHGEARATVDIRFANLGPIERVKHAVSTPSFVFVLLTLGLAALAFELTQPGFGFAGFSGVSWWGWRSMD